MMKLKVRIDEVRSPSRASIVMTSYFNLICLLKNPKTGTLNYSSDLSKM